MNPEQDDQRYRINVSVQSEFLPSQSDEENNRWAFAYHVTLRNDGSQPAKLLTRHWVITDSEEHTQEVHGEGVVGEQPHLEPGQEYQYTSGAVLEARVGTMHGSYQMLAEDGTCFDAEIPPFRLAPPYTVH